MYSNFRICTENTLINFPGNYKIFAHASSLSFFICELESRNGIAIPCLHFLKSLEKRYIVNYMIITGSILKGGELIHAGLADYMIPHEKLKMLE